MDRLIMMLAARDPAAVESLLRRHEHALRESATRAGARVRLAVRLENDPLAAEAGGPRTIHPIDVLVELTTDAGTDLLTEAAAEAAALLGDAIDWAGSATIVGEVHEVLPTASDAVLLVLGANRLPSIERSDFHGYWLNKHATLAMSLLDDAGKSQMGYQQVHADEERSNAAARRTSAGTSSFDGVLEVGLAEVTDLPHLTVPGFAEAIMEDEQNFADQDAPMLGAFMRTISGATS